MLQVPLLATPNQTVSVSLSGQSCKIVVQQRTNGMYCTLYANDVLIIAGVICQNLNRIVRDLYLGFIGDLGFYDTQGLDDPVYTGFGTNPRFLLIYLEPSDLGGAG